MLRVIQCCIYSLIWNFTFCVSKPIVSHYTRGSRNPIFGYIFQTHNKIQTLVQNNSRHFEITAFNFSETYSILFCSSCFHCLFEFLFLIIRWYTVPFLLLIQQRLVGVFVVTSKWRMPSERIFQSTRHSNGPCRASASILIFSFPFTNARMGSSFSCLTCNMVYLYFHSSLCVIRS